MMTSISQRLSKFKQWQQDSSRHIAQPSNAQHDCTCCGTHFSGNFCPQCGQKAGTGRISWNTVRQGVSMLWGMDTRSLPYTLWQLLLRPGYLIGDYISGKRQVSFPPVKMLALVAVLVFLVLEDTSEPAGDDKIGEYYIVFNCVLTYIEKHYDAAFLFFFSMLIVPTYFVFRFSPRYPRHNLAEGFFIDVFNSTLGLIVLLIVEVVWGLFTEESIDEHPFPLIIIAVLMVYRSYHQLFGYGYWATLWRTLTVFIAGGLMMAVLLIIDNLVSLMIGGRGDMALYRLTHRFIPNLLSLIVVLAASYFISRRTAKRRAPLESSENAVCAGENE